MPPRMFPETRTIRTQEATTTRKVDTTDNTTRINSAMIDGRAVPAELWSLGSRTSQNEKRLTKAKHIFGTHELAKEIRSELGPFRFRGVKS
mmetsp:Transcript_28387/g.111392  ORF Transcript_28387/g.111392 Transcript_28387/m.111392 type:complete len:91 (-) Transcript_28387:450-722(-)